MAKRKRNQIKENEQQKETKSCVQKEIKNNISKNEPKKIKLKGNQQKSKRKKHLKKIKNILEDTIIRKEKKELDKSNKEGFPVLKFMIDQKEKKDIKNKKIKVLEIKEKENDKNDKINNSVIKRLLEDEENKKGLSISEFNEDKNSKVKMNDISSLELEQNFDFHFLTKNKETWCKYLNLNEEQFISLFNRIIEIVSQKKNNIVLLNELISKLGILIDSQKNIEDAGGFSSDKVIADIWLLDQFNGYYTDVFKRKHNISNYKIRYGDIIKNVIDIKWRNILFFLGFKKEYRFENIYDYWWFLWFLPKRLLIIWIAKIDIIKAEDIWWIKLLFEWKEYIFEILRRKGIKNWLMTFVEDDKNND